MTSTTKQGRRRTREEYNDNDMDDEEHISGWYLYTAMMKQLVDIDTMESQIMWNCLTPEHKQIWIDLGYTETMEAFQDNGKPMKLKLCGESDGLAIGIYIDMMLCRYHTYDEANEMWEVLSTKDKELFMLMCEGNFF